VGRACFPGAVASGVLEVRSDLDGLDRGGFWAVVVTFEVRSPACGSPT